MQDFIHLDLLHTFHAHLAQVFSNNMVIYLYSATYDTLTGMEPGTIVFYLILQELALIYFTI